MTRNLHMMSGSKHLTEKLKELILMGVTAPKIADCAKTHGFDKIKFVDSMEEAVSYIAGKAQDGEAVFIITCMCKLGECSRIMKSGEISSKIVSEKLKGELKKVANRIKRKNIWPAKRYFDYPMLFLVIFLICFGLVYDL